MKGMEAAVAIVLVRGEQGQELLLIHRAELPSDPWSGQMGLPGGRREPGDKSLLDTAIRETQEETGIPLDPRSLLGALDDLKPRNRSIPKVIIRPHVFSLACKPPVVPNPEVAEYFWIDVGKLKAGACRVHVPERTLAVDAYRIGPHIVWGITQRILSAFLLKNF